MPPSRRCFWKKPTKLSKLWRKRARAGHNELRDELGDLLFQIVFYAQVAKERGEFSIDDVTKAIHAKMVRRHPHVFGDTDASDTATVLRNWEAMKQDERRAAGKSEREGSLLDGVSSKAPALMEAHQLSTKAARVGFDWQKLEDIFAKLEEEIGELRAAIQTMSRRTKKPITHASAKRSATYYSQ